MKSSTELRTLLRSIDHKSYPAYKSLAGAWDFKQFHLLIDHVQGDPFASPSSLHIEIPHTIHGLPASYYAKDCMRIALQDYLTRQLASQFEQYNFKAKGSGKSGLISISQCGQRVLERSACQITDTHLILRFHVGFPAFGRTINAGELEKILFDFLPKCIEASCLYKNLNKADTEAAVCLAEDQAFIREFLAQEGYVAFVANGSILPRKSGISQLPLKDSIPFCSPATMECTLQLPHHGSITGMAIPKGITLIVGGGYHGKSTLLGAIQDGVYNHIRGDGREFVITDASAMKLRAEDGRSVRNVDISLFINDLPNKKDTHAFATEDASGSTSQAAGVIEGMEAGTRLFLIDEDTSATNFMVRDSFMQEIISRDKEPITPFIERVRDLYEKEDISTILVAGSSGAFFYIADHILQMDAYHTLDITKQVQTLCATRPMPESTCSSYTTPQMHRVLPGYQQVASGGRRQAYRGRGNDRSLKLPHAKAGHEHMKIKSNGVESLSLDKASIDVRYLEQLIDPEQTTALAYLMRYLLENTLDGSHTVQEVVTSVMNTLEHQGWNAFCSSYIPCGLAVPRVQEFYSCLNRFRG